MARHHFYMTSIHPKPTNQYVSYMVVNQSATTNEEALQHDIKGLEKRLLHITYVTLSYTNVVVRYII